MFVPVKQANNPIVVLPFLYNQVLFSHALVSGSEVSATYFETDTLISRLTRGWKYHFFLSSREGLLGTLKRRITVLRPQTWNFVFLFRPNTLQSVWAEIFVTQIKLEKCPLDDILRYHYFSGKILYWYCENGDLEIMRMGLKFLFYAFRRKQHSGIQT